MRTVLSAALMVAVVLGLTACGHDEERPKFVDSSADPALGAEAKPVQPAVPLSLEVTPATDTRNLPISTEIGTRVAGGKVTSVTLRDDKGGAVGGAMREDGSSWVPAKPLRYGRSYAAEVVATAPDGTTQKRTTKFATMRSAAGRELGTGLYLFSGNTYGVAMPVVVEFNPGIAAKDRAGVQKRLFVRSDPPQPGVWHWVANGTQAYYRPPQYWKPGTKLTVRMALDGHPAGRGYYGRTDRNATVTIGRNLTMDVDNKTKRMSVYKDGSLVKQIPVSLGKKSTPSSSGTMVVMEKKESTVFDTFAELGPSEGYRTNIAYAQRLTWGGEFIHSAPWSVGDQGRRNVSHGCVNMSPGNAVWLYRQTLIGDPVTVRGTETKITDGNGWTAWNLPWREFIKSSALPVPADLAAADDRASGGSPSGTPSSSVSPVPASPVPASPAHSGPAAPAAPGQR